MFIPFTLQALCLVGGADARQTLRELVHFHHDDSGLLYLGQHVPLCSRPSSATTTAPSALPQTMASFTQPRAWLPIGGGGIAAWAFLKFGNSERSILQHCGTHAAFCVCSFWCCALCRCPSRASRRNQRSSRRKQDKEFEVGSISRGRPRKLCGLFYWIAGSNLL